MITETTSTSIELDGLSNALEGALEPLRAALAGHSAMAAGIAQELRELELVRTRAQQLLRSGGAGVSRQAAAEQVRASLARVLRLTDCLEHLRPAVPGTLGPTNLAERAVRRLALLAPQIEARDLTVTPQTPRTIARGDAALLARAVDEVVDNAVHHNAMGGWIELSTEMLGNRALLRIANGGAVIEPDAVRALADPFRRLGRSEHAGPGLGLTLVSRIVHAHGGTLWISAPPSGGLAAELELPGDSAESPLPSGRRRRGEEITCGRQ